MSELEFIQTSGSGETNQCRGQIVGISLDIRAANYVADFFHSAGLGPLFMGGLTNRNETTARFDFCVRHWFDFTSLLYGRAKQESNPYWEQAAKRLYRGACQAAGWDYRELENMVGWAVLARGKGSQSIR